MGKTTARWVGIVLAVLGFGVAVWCLMMRGSFTGLPLAVSGAMGIVGVLIATRCAPNKRPVITVRKPTRPKNPNH
ncbi:MAG TPA: hypothetical protein VNE39_20095 [Planctomycetota bacterium]|nr:hypothetical protein [Planctomycetota bacterium]